MRIPTIFSQLLGLSPSKYRSLRLAPTLFVLVAAVVLVLAPCLFWKRMKTCGDAKSTYAKKQTE